MLLTVSPMTCLNMRPTPDGMFQLMSVGPVLSFFLVSRQRDRKQPGKLPSRAILIEGEDRQKR
jgi:hypothetical protein